MAPSHRNSGLYDHWLSGIMFLSATLHAHAVFVPIVARYHLHREKEEWLFFFGLLTHSRFAPFMEFFFFPRSRYLLAAFILALIIGCYGHYYKIVKNGVAGYPEVSRSEETIIIHGMNTRSHSHKEGHGRRRFSPPHP